MRIVVVVPGPSGVGMSLLDRSALLNAPSYYGGYEHFSTVCIVGWIKYPSA